MTLYQPELELSLESAKSFPRILFSVLFSFQIAKLTLEVSVNLDSRHLSKCIKLSFTSCKLGFLEPLRMSLDSMILLFLEPQTSLDFQDKYYEKVKFCGPSRLLMKLLQEVGHASLSESK